jgi:ethanolamine utilization protein EutQ (cupin superfamily)
MSTTTAAPETTAAPQPSASETEGIRIVRGGYVSLPSMQEAGSISNIRDAHSNPGTCVMCSGFFEHVHSKPLYYEYTYDEMKIVLEGELVLHDAVTDTTVRAQRFDVMFIPNGSKVTFTTPTRGLAFYCGHRDFPA